MIRLFEPFSVGHWVMGGHCLWPIACCEIVHSTPVTSFIASQREREREIY